MKNKIKEMEEIWIKYHPKLQVYLKQLFPNTFDVEERVSEILLEIFENLDNYNPQYSLSTWIYRIARNTQLDSIRKKTLETYNTNSELYDNARDTEEELLYKENIDEINNAIKTLDPIYRELIYLHYYEDYKYKDISEITETPIGTIKYRMYLAKKELKQLLKGVMK